MNTDKNATPSSNQTATGDQNETALGKHKVMRRGLLAVLGGFGAAAMFKVTGAKAATDTTVIGAAKPDYGVLASPGTGAPPLPALAPGTNHGVIGCNTENAFLPMSSGVAGARSDTSQLSAGVLGIHGNAGYGVFGKSEKFVGVHGASESAPGVRGFSQSGFGVHGRSATNYAVVCQTAAPNKAALYAQSTAPTAATQIAGLFKGNVRVQGNFAVTGAKAAAVALPNGELATMYCQESPEPFFEDFGRAQLVNGVARVSLESEFASLIHRDNYMVFPVPEGDSNGLFVSNRDQAGFEVRELKGGTSNLTFTYRLVGKRKDIPGERLARLDRFEEPNLAAFDDKFARPSA